MPGVKTNEVAGTRAVLRHYRMSAYKARQVLDLIRGRDADRAEEILNATPREAARVIGKVLASAVANARNNDQLDPDELFVSACYADEGTTLKRWRPRARGRATRIRKRTCHITVIVSRLPEDRLERRRARQATETSGLRSRRVAASRRGGDADGTETLSSQSATADAAADVEDLDVTSTDVDEGEGGDDDEAGAEVEAETDVEAGAESGTDVAEAEGEAEDFKEPEWLNDELDGPDAAAETPAETEAEAEEQAPPAKPRRARARKSTTKAAPAADESDAGGSGEEEKG